MYNHCESWSILPQPRITFDNQGYRSLDPHLSVFKVMLEFYHIEKQNFIKKTVKHIWFSLPSLFYIARLHNTHKQQ